MATTVQTLVLVTGASPGLGKSSLAAGLVVRLQGENHHADLFREEEILSDCAFAPMMEEFRSTGEVPVDALLAAADVYLTSVRALPTGVLVLDALLPYLPSLLAWGYTNDEIAAFFGRLARSFAGFVVIELHLTGDVRSALSRAAEREGADWIDNHLAKAARFRSPRPISTIDDVVAYYDECAIRSRTLLAAAPWRVVFIDTDQGEEPVLASARAAIASAVGIA
jgi:hypothetical protein